MKRRLNLIVPTLGVIMLTAGAPGRGQITAWHTETNKAIITDIQSLGDSLVIATQGGVLLFDRISRQFVSSFTNSDGLSHNQAVSAVIDASANWWVGLQNGHLNRYGGDGATWDLFRDFEQLIIHDMKLQGDSLFVALDIGVSVFLIDKQEAKETYKKLGDIPVEIDAWTSLIDWPNLYVGSDFGLSVADLRQINLKAPQSWDNYASADGLQANTIRAIASHDGAVFVATSVGVQRFENGSFLPAYATLPARQATAFAESGGVLRVAVDRTVYRYDDVGDTWAAELTLDNPITALLIDASGIFWLGSAGQGLNTWNPATNEQQVYAPDGPAGNSFIDSIVDSEGRFWSASTSLSGDGLYRFDGATWTNLTTAGGDIPRDETVAVSEDLQGSIWVGTWGSGVYRISAEGEITIFDQTDGRLAGIPTDLGFVVVNDVAVDQEGVVWMTNFQAYNGDKLVAVTPAGAWLHFGSDEGIASANPTCIAIDSFNRKWVGTDGGGITVYDDNRTAADPGDDIVGVLTRSDGLSSNIIRALAFDEFNVLWIATNEGLEYYQNGEVRPQFGLITTDINTIEIDPVGNKWIGTSAGLSILNRDDFTWTHYTTENSPLANGNVISFSFNGRTGTGFVGTSNGLSVVQTLFVTPAETLSGLKLFPNPFILGGAASATVDGLCRDCDVNIYTASGFLVKTLVMGSRGGRAIWDGTDNDGEPVASGIYIAVAVQSDGTSRSGKIAVINR